MAAHCMFSNIERIEQDARYQELGYKQELYAEYGRVNHVGSDEDGWCIGVKRCKDREQFSFYCSYSESPDAPRVKGELTQIFYDSSGIFLLTKVL